MAGTTHRHIAARAGVPLGSITYHSDGLGGGHFAAHEEPELLAHDLTEFFRAHR